MKVLTRYSSIIGPMIGGALAKPADVFPSIFPPGSLFDRYPYLLPNLFSAVCVFIGFFIGVLFLEETHEEKKQQRDRGVELGKHLLSYFQRKGLPSRRGKILEEQPLLESEDQLPGYRSTHMASQLATSAGPSFHQPLDLESSVITRVAAPEMRPPSTIFTRPVVLIIISYGILA
jgi:hypothetical protein